MVYIKNDVYRVYLFNMNTNLDKSGVQVSEKDFGLP